MQLREGAKHNREFSGFYSSRRRVVQDNKNNDSIQLLLLLRIIFSICAFFFFLMGIMLIFFPHLVTRSFTEGVLHPAITGIIRGAGGSIIPYSLLYVFAALKPLKRRWALVIIGLANAIAIILDFISVGLGEYRLAYAMIDVPVEALSLGIIIVFYYMNRSSISKNS